MKRWIHAATEVKSSISVDELKDWYPADEFPEFADKLEDAYEIEWNINIEDVECVLEDDISLADVAAISYVSDEDEEKLQELGYEGGYRVEYTNGKSKVFAWLPYPRNLEELTEVSSFRRA